MKIWKVFEYLLIALILMTFTSCSSSGGGIGGSGAVSKPVVSKGTITGFGSVKVNGVEFETTGAAITTDDDSGKTQGDLDIGMVVTVRGIVNPDGFTGTADSIEFADSLEGPITDTPNCNAQTIIVLGQTVAMDSSTKDGSGNPLVCATLAKENLVEVSGFLTTTGIQATRIEVKDPNFDPTKEVELKGTVKNLNTQTKTFFIGEQEIHYTTGTVFEGVTEGTLDNKFVEVKGNIDHPSLVVLHATKIELEEEGLASEEGKEVEIEGLVSDFTSPCSGLDCTFKVNGQPVQTNSATGLKNGAPSDIANGVRVEVEGTITNGVLIAREVFFL